MKADELWLLWASGIVVLVVAWTWYSYDLFPDSYGKLFIFGVVSLLTLFMWSAWVLRQVPDD